MEPSGNYRHYNDPEALVNLCGGQNKFTGMLDELFTLQPEDSHIGVNEDGTRDGILPRLPRFR